MTGVTKKAMKFWWVFAGVWAILAGFEFPDFECTHLFLIGLIFIVKGL